MDHRLELISKRHKAVSKQVLCLSVVVLTSKVSSTCTVSINGSTGKCSFVVEETALSHSRHVNLEREGERKERENEIQILASSRTMLCNH